MRLIVLGLFAVIGYFFFALAADGAEPKVEILVPPTIEECRSDMQCDIAAAILCDGGLTKWCITVDESRPESDSDAGL
jgi:hypothetical protein